MRRILAAALAISAAAWAGEKKLASGEVSNDRVQAVGTILDADAMQQTFGSDFNGMFTVVEITLTPKGGKPLDVHLDDFLLRSEQTGEHTGPLAPSQIAGQESLVVHQNPDQTGRSRGGFSGGLGPIMMGGMGSAEPPAESKVEIKNSAKKDPMLDVLKRKILAEKPIEQPVTGLLFFPIGKEKPGHLNLTYTTPTGKLRMKFK
jgi:hypothetical protein